MWFLVAAALALPAAPKKELRLPVTHLQVGTACYPSGLQVTFVHRPGTELAAVTMVVGGGTSYETEDNRGAAHLVEHLWFESSPGGETRLWDRSAGLEMSATTESDATTYTTIGAAADLAALLAIEAERLRDPLQGIDDDALRREQDIVRHELLLRGEHGARLARQQLDQVLFPEDHRYHSLVSGGDAIAALDLEALRSYTDLAYQPATTSIRIEADVPVEQQSEIASEALAELTEGTSNDCAHEPSPRLPEGPPSTEPLVIGGAVWNTRLYLGWTLPAGWKGDDSRYRMAAAALGRLLYVRLRFVNGMTGEQEPEVGCSYQPGRLASRVTCMVELPPRADAGRALTALRGSLSNQWSHSANDLGGRIAVTRSLRSGHFRAQLLDADAWHPDVLVERAIRSHHGAPPDTLQEDMSTVLSTREKHMAAMAEQWLTPERMAALVVESDPDAVAVGKQISGTARLQAPALPGWTSVEPDLSSVQSHELDSGLDVVTTLNGTAPAIQAALVQPGGTARAPSGAEDLWDRLARYPFEVFELRSELGIATYTDVGPMSLVDLTVASGGSLDLALWQLRLLWTQGEVDISERQPVLDRALAATTTELGTWPWLQTRNLRMRHLLGDHPAAIDQLDRLAAARKLRFGDLLRWRKSTAAGTTLVMGGTDRATALASAERYLGQRLKRADPLPSWVIPPAPPPRRVMALPIGSLLSDVAVSCRLATPAGSDTGATEVLERLVELGLWQTLREDGGTYAPTASTQMLQPGLSMLTMRAQVSPNQTAGTTLAMLDLLRTIHDGAPEATLAWARADAGGRRARTHAASSTHVDAVVERVSAGLPPSELEPLASIDAPAVSALLDDCVQHEAVTVIGPQVDSLLREGGVEADTIDWVAAGGARAAELTE